MLMKNNTYHLIQIHKEGHAVYNWCIVYHYHRERYIYDDETGRKCMMSYFFDGDIWMGGIGSCQD